MRKLLYGETQTLDNQVFDYSRFKALTGHVMCKYEPLGLATCEVANKSGIFLSDVLGPLSTQFLKFVLGL